MNWIKIMNFEPIVYLIRKMWKNDKENYTLLSLLLLASMPFFCYILFSDLKNIFIYFLIGWLEGINQCESLSLGEYSAIFEDIL